MKKWTSWGAASALLSLLLFGAVMILPRLSPPRSKDGRLSLLRGKAQAVRGEFRRVLEEVESRRKKMTETAGLISEADRFRSMKRLDLDEETCGAAYLDREGRLKTWLGRVLDLGQVYRDQGVFRGLVEAGRCSIVKAGSSVYLVAPQRLGEGTLMHFRLLTFRAQFRSRYLSDYHFLPSGLARYGDVDFWDYEEDLAGFERIFSRHRDEYFGQNPAAGTVSSLIFPLRLGDGRIAATVTLSLPAPAASAEAVRRNLLLALSLSVLISGMLLLIYLARPAASHRLSPALRAAFFIAVLAALRASFLALGEAGAFGNMTVFSPSRLAVRSLGGLTSSPADFFLTSLCFLAALMVLVLPALRKAASPGARRPVLLTLPLSLAVILIALALFHGLQSALGSLVDNCSLNLLRFTWSFDFVLIHIGLLAFTLSVGLSVFTAFRYSGRAAGGPLLPLVALPLSAVLALVLFLPASSPVARVMPILGVSALLSWAMFLPRPAPGRDLFLTTVLAALFLAVVINDRSARRESDLVQGALRSTVTSQEDWASFFLEESLDLIDRSGDLVLRAMTGGGNPEAARRLWERTAIARFNWYSSLEILDAEGKTVSRFALNVPRSFQPSPDLPPSEEWTVTALSVPFIGREKEFLVGYRDWRQDTRPLGRTIVSVSLDYDLLPFLYSANPYFELLRVHSLPSLEQIDLEFIVFDADGLILFNPGRLTSGPPSRLFPRLLASPEGRWIRWTDRGRSMSAFCFPHGGRLYALGLPGKGPLDLASQFLKLFFLYGPCLAVPLAAAALARRRPWLRSLGKSFSNRVYASFLIIALVPLLLLALFTRSYFSGVYSRQFTRAAERDADLTRNVLKDFLLLQREERNAVIPPPEDLVLWVSAAIGNDVNLYRDGRLLASSRREFFDYGILPELMNGELHHRFSTEITPFLTERRKFGSFSFNTLTIPFDAAGARYHISLPFPFEQEEVAGAASRLVDVLLLASIFVALAVAAVAHRLGSAIVTPIRKLLTGAREVELGNLEVSLEHKPDDEMQGLFQGFNAMVRSLKQHQQELAEMSQRAAWAEMARKVAHEVKNPLTPIQLSAEHLLHVYQDGKSDFGRALKEAVSYITTEVENLRKIAQEFLVNSRESALRREPTDVRELVEEALAPYKSVLTERISVEESYAPLPLVCAVDRSKIQIVLRNLLINALESISGRGSIRVLTAAENGTAVIEVADSGSGMSPEVLERVFELHFSKKPLGTGLGLPIAKKIVEDHGGSLRLTSHPGRGTRATIRLPLGTD